MSIETARVVRKLKPFDDNSGHFYTITVSRTRKEIGGESEVTIAIESGSDVVVIKSEHWDEVREAVEASATYARGCTE